MIRRTATIRYLVDFEVTYDWSAPGVARLVQIQPPDCNDPDYYLDEVLSDNAMGAIEQRMKEDARRYDENGSLKGVK